VLAFLHAGVDGQLAMTNLFGIWDLVIGITLAF
jgi:hypothetical protein